MPLIERHLLMITCLVSIGVTQASLGLQSNEGRRARGPNPPVERDTRPFVTPSVSKVVSFSDLQVLIGVIQLSDAQEEAFRALYEEYAERDRAFRDDVLASLIGRGRDLHELDTMENSEDAVLMAVFTEDCRKATVKAEALVDGLLVSVSPLLSSNQVDLLRRARAIRKRQASRGLGRSFRPADLDVFLLLQSTLRDMDTILTADSSEKLVEIFDVYDLESSKLAAMRTSGTYRMKGEFCSIFATAYEAWVENPGDVKTIRDRRRRQLHESNRQYRSSLRKQWTLNRSTVTYICEAVPTDVASHFENAFRAITHPVVWPDPYGLTLLFQKIEELYPGQGDVIHVLYDEWRSREEAFNREMRRRNDDWNIDEFIRESRIREQPFDAYQKRMRQLDVERKGNATQTIALLIEKIGPLNAEGTAILEMYLATQASAVGARNLVFDTEAGWPPPYERAFVGFLQGLSRIETPDDDPGAVGDYVFEFTGGRARGRRLGVVSMYEGGPLVKTEFNDTSEFLMATESQQAQMTEFLTEVFPRP